MSKLYPKKSLAEKLGIKKDLAILVVDSPYNYKSLIGINSTKIKISKKYEGKYNFIHFFCNDIIKLENEFAVLKQFLEYNGALWISWPKKSSELNTNLNENIIREIGLKNGLVDVKVISINKVWSGLKFVYRIKDRL